ncbi:MAG: hypothetical protein POELPBGB_03972 [Bacteroidia bacterium]|nr:hypothetical protein [Bacteroidia bacterium]
MSRIKSRDTSPEIEVRHLLFLEGYRYRKNVSNLPGSPDIAFLGRRKAVFVNGCFWHMHKGCANSKIPATRQIYWKAKLTNNVARDRRNYAELKALGWEIAIVWECELANLVMLKRRLIKFLGAPSNQKARLVQKSLRQSRKD